jgi:hypothetical protein
MASSLPPDPATHRQQIMDRAAARGRLDYTDIDELGTDHTPDEVTSFVTEWYGTPDGQIEAAKAGKGGADPAELARLVMGGR